MTDAPASEEALDASPRSVPGSSLVAYTDWRKSASSARRPSSLYDVRINAAGSTLTSVPFSSISATSRPSRDTGSA